MVRLRIGITVTNSARGRTYRNAFIMRQISKSLVIRSACALALGLAVITLPEVAMAQVSVSITTLRSDWTIDNLM